jgi:hypothetical protein
MTVRLARFPRAFHAQTLTPSASSTIVVRLRVAFSISVSLVGPKNLEVIHSFIVRSSWALRTRASARSGIEDQSSPPTSSSDNADILTRVLGSKYFARETETGTENFKVPKAKTRSTDTSAFEH